ncbi:cell envelope biogenesis protein AsmA [Roseobacter cerasinus]|uniref:Cell envelope biogenesis protein AsmA n=1 Tax=Roseobacter cerasinus TaxID=2602289 RepID=A0A640VQB1_9RHOB|nr:AsmA family protein [Roseobacter cerasinus]GFE48396.1 cell envelope biogenesis protein AsmA [Roseobacter cerasinus]
MKWVMRLLGVVVLLIVVAVVSMLFLPAERVAKIAAEQLRGVTGRDVQITGDVALTVWPVLGARVGGLEVGNADWAEQGPMLQAANAAIGVDAMALLQGDIRITNIEAESPTIRLEQKADGRASWQFTDASGTAQIETETAPDRPARSISIERLQVTDATLIYDAEGSDLVSYSGVDLSLDWPERLGPAEIAATLRPTANPVGVAATIDGFAGFITGETQTLRATIDTEAGAIGFDGRASTAGAVAGTLTVKTANTAAFLQALGLPGADLPPDLGRSIDLSTTLTLTPDRQLALRDLIVGLGANRITGAADIGLNGVPQVNAQLNVGDLDLSGGEAASTAGSGGGSGGPANSGWPSDPIDAGGLAAFNGEIALTASSIDLGQFDLGATRALLRNENSRMVFELREVAAYGGGLTGEFVINNRAGLSVGGQLAANAIQMQPLLNDAAELDRLTGQGDARLSFLGSGSSIDAIMKSLSGDGSLQIGQGTILGIDLDRLMRSGDTSPGTTVFDSLGGTWTVAGGVLNNRDLLLQLSNYRASGEGVVGLGTRTLDYTVTPIALRANSGQGVSIPVRFVGPWSNISIRPDVEAALKAEADAKVDELENRAKEKIGERLGISEENGQSVEDAVKDRLLRKLFD